MSTTATRSSAPTRMKQEEKVDVTAFAGNVQEFSREVMRVTRAPRPTGKNTSNLARNIAKLEKDLQVLRYHWVGNIPGSVPRTTTSTVAAKPASSPKPLILDTTEAMISKEQLVDPVRFQELMGWKTRQAVWKAATDNRVFFMEHQAERYFPAFYADPAYQRAHLEAVTKILGDLPGGSKLQFFLTRKGSLGGKTPLEALAAGGLAKVKDVATAFAEVPLKA